MTRLHRVNPRSINQRPFRSRPSRATIYAAAGTVLAASAAVTGLIVFPADASKPLPTAADAGRLSTAGDRTNTTYPSLAGPTVREVHNLEARAQAAYKALIARREAAAVHAAAVRAAQRRAAAQAAAQRQQVQRQAVRHQVTKSTSAVPAAQSGSPQQIAMSMLAQFGWPSSQFSCLDSLWQRESGWNPYAANPYSGAYGIPQALPGAKMASAGADWSTNAATQIRWGLGYIKATYGSPCAAWGHETVYGSY